MRILLLTQWFDPEPTFKGLGFARRLQEAGHDVEVLTGFPNYPGGRLYPGYKVRPFQRQRVDGVGIVRVALYPSHDSSPVRRVANYASFALSAATLGALLAKRPDVIYVHHPPLTVGIAAVLLSRLWRVPFVYDVQDLWPDTLASTGMLNDERALHAIGKVCDWVYGRAERLVAQSPGFRQALIDRGVPKGKINLVFNWCDEEKLRLQSDPSIRKRLQAGTRFNVVFAGTMGRAQGLENLLDAAVLIAPEAPNVHFILVGGGIEVERLTRSTAERGLQNVTFLPRMSMSDVGSVLDVADVLLVHLADDPLFTITIPSKTQAYLSVGKPVLMAVRGDAADLIEAAEAGVTCPPGDPQRLAETILSLSSLSPEALAAMGARGQAFYGSELSLDAGARKFLDIFERIAE